MPPQIRVEPHDPAWAEAFLRESRRVAAALGTAVVAVHHVGSTSIPGIWAKPIIDMLVEAHDVAALDGCEDAMRALGYEPKGEFGIIGRRYYRRDDENGVRTHHVHAFDADSPQTVRHLALRDYLRAHPETARRYSDLKRELARLHPDDMSAYMDGKGPFIREIDRRAAEWRTSL